MLKGCESINIIIFFTQDISSLWRFSLTFDARNLFQLLSSLFVCHQTLAILLQTLRGLLYLLHKCINVKLVTLTPTKMLACGWSHAHCRVLIRLHAFKLLRLDKMLLQ